MEPQHRSSPHLLLEIGISDLHRESQQWLQEIEFWDFELGFFQKLLEKATVRTTAADDKKQVDHFQHLITYFQGELLDGYRHDLRTHEASLKKLSDEKSGFDDQLYRDVHLHYRNQIEAFAKDFRQYKTDLFRFTERFL